MPPEETPPMDPPASPRETTPWEITPLGPTVGRVVHYVAFGTPGGEYAAGAHRAAIITEVPPGTLAAPAAISLCIFNPTGLHWRAGVAYDPRGAPGTWHWCERV